MGQKLKDDKIGTLSQSGGIVYLAPSILTIGGQQYNITSTLQVTLSGLTTTTLYKFYVVLSSGIPTLIYSSNNNSVGPAGYTSWKLVGAFFSNSTFTNSFTSFLDINNPLNLDFSVSGNYQGCNTSIASHLSIAYNSDNWGLIVPETGSFTASTGNWTTNPKIVFPSDGFYTFDLDVSWYSIAAANYANTWTMYVNKSGSNMLTAARNAWGANAATAGLQWLFLDRHGRFGVVASDYIEQKIMHDYVGTTISCGISTARYNFKSTKAIKDL